MAFFLIMKKYRRVKHNEEFQQIINRSQKRTSGLYVVYSQPKKKEKNRVGISVSKKSGNAVFRNLVKRQVRMMVAETGALEMDRDLIIIVRKNYDPGDYQGNKKALESVLKQVIIKYSTNLKETSE